mgnify:CR=1 FL=1
MTVKELIENLKRFDQDLVIICNWCEESSVPFPRIEKHDFNYSYWDEHSHLKSIPKNTEFIVL